MPTIDVSFRIDGEKMPADHGYQTLSAISRLVPSIHSDSTCGIFPVNGVNIGNRFILLNERSRLVFRLSHEKLPELLKLAGKKILISECQLRIGIPEVFALKPSSHLKSRLVTIKGFMEPEPFLEAAVRQLSEMGINGKPALALRASQRSASAETSCQYIRRTLRVKDKEIVGYAMIVESLTAEESILLQEKGIGGRRRMGCGLFLPYKG